MKKMFTITGTIETDQRDDQVENQLTTHLENLQDVNVDVVTVSDDTGDEEEDEEEPIE